MGSNSALQISEVSQVNAWVDGVNKSLALLNGNANGRPPNTNMLVIGYSRLKWLTTLVCVEDQKEIGECCMLCDGSDDPDKGSNPRDPVQAELGYKPSFQDMLAGKHVSASPSPTIPDPDVELMGDDVQFSSVDGPEGMKGKFDVLAAIENDHKELKAAEAVDGQVHLVNNVGNGGDVVAGDKAMGNKRK
ncbi:hypothetical protein V6N11_044017 [Hibiscus sabdariffa]|uniref:Uncharacterized protein n=1 Tax=Hibiscus sabdariffa TaxID=183260 RepID=A0ABR2RDZ3_9ROSI